MSKLGSKTLSELIRDHVPGHSLPGEVYGRQDIFEVDMEVFFKEHWIVAGVTADVPEPGDVSTVDIGNASVIIIRDDEENIRAFRNVCRHRGARLKEPGKSTVGMLVCPYHQWTYTLEGDLAHATNMGSNFDKTCKNLIPVPVRVVGAHILICLADEPPSDIETLAEVMQSRFAPYDLQNTKIAFETEIVEYGNWKLVIENNRECYHCAAGHPELNLSFLPEDFGISTSVNGAASEGAEERAEQRNKLRELWAKEGHAFSAVEYLEEPHVTQFRTQGCVIGGAGESQTLDTKVASTKLLGQVTRRDLGDTHFWTHSSWTHVMSDHAVVSWLIPESPGRTIVRTKWLVHKDAVEGVDYDLSNLTEVWKATNQQDANLVAVNYKGTQDPAYIPGEYSNVVEGYLEQFTRWYIARLRAHGFIEPAAQ